MLGSVYKPRLGQGELKCLKLKAKYFKLQALHTSSWGQVEGDSFPLVFCSLHLCIHQRSAPAAALANQTRLIAIYIVGHVVQLAVNRGAQDLSPCNEGHSDKRGKKRVLNRAYA